MTRQPGIPLEIQAEVQKLVEEFNQKKFKKVNQFVRKLIGGNVDIGYSVRFKGKFLYLDHSGGGKKPSNGRRLWESIHPSRSGVCAMDTC